MTPPRMNLPELRLLAGWVCLDFVNSIENRAGHEPQDFLTSYPDLVRWFRHAGLINDATTARLIAFAALSDPEARETLVWARALRDMLHRVFLAVVEKRSPELGDLKELQSAYATAITGATLVQMDQNFAWDWQADASHPVQLFWAVTHSAIELLTTGNLQRIKVCENPYGCGWLFYDNSKNGSRRWCSMEGCGSQIKMRRHYAKRRDRAAG